jgi:cytochrome c oxidase assembly protein Cox11
MIFFSIWNIPIFQYFCDVPYDIEFFNSSNDSLLFYNVESQLYLSMDMFYIDKHIKEHSLVIDFLYFINIMVYFYYTIIGTCDFNFFFFSVDEDLSVLNFTNMNTSYILEILFHTTTTSYYIEFVSLQRSVFIVPEETHLVFFRMINNSLSYINGVSIYFVYPNEYVIFFEKIQCFCFEEILLFPYEIIDLPVIFYLIQDIYERINVDCLNKVDLHYFFLMK